MIYFENTYVSLPATFYDRINPTLSSSPKLIRFNNALARELGIESIEPDELAAFFVGNKLLDGSEPLAMAYAGHQFGHFVPQLGDGRAILLGEVVDTTGIRRDIQLKGAGRTRFSRGGDGRAALGPVLREYIVSEAMHALGVRTSRSLAAVLTGDPVYRETPLPGAILTRVASSHIRVGTFEYFAARQDTDSIKILADYVIERHYPDLGTSNVYAQLFNSIAAAQADLVSDWMRVGFIHGVMNTDNITVSGETIDYGPCAFMDEYDHGKVFSSIDQYGRYAFGNQPKIMQWNLENLGACLVPLFGEDEEHAIEIIKNGIRMFQSEFTRHWQEKMCAKIGIFDSKPEDLTFLQDLLTLMKRHLADFTNVFRSLSTVVSQNEEDRFAPLLSNSIGVQNWLELWKTRVLSQDLTPLEIEAAMNKVNPAFIPRNHRIEEAIVMATSNNDFSEFETLLQVLAKPYEYRSEFEEYTSPPTADQRVTKTFCGT